MQRWSGTGRLVFPPPAMNPWDPHAPLEWVTVSSRGTIGSFAVPRTLRSCCSAWRSRPTT